MRTYRKSNLKNLTSMPWDMLSFLYSMTLPLFTSGSKKRGKTRRNEARIVTANDFAADAKMKKLTSFQLAI